MPQDKTSIFIGSRTLVLAAGTRLNNTDTKSIACSRLGVDWLGNLKMTCSQGTLVSDAQHCLAPCPKDQKVVVSMGDSITIKIPKQMTSAESMSSTNCSELGSIYSGKIRVNCTNGALISDVSGCKTDTNAQTDTVEMISHGFALAMPIASGTNLSAVQEAMNHPAAYDAFADSISTGLGLLAIDIKILGVDVLQSRRLSIVDGPRELAGASSASVSVSYQVRSDAAKTAGLDAAALKSRMTGLGDSKSAENKKFTAALAPNLKTAASKMPGGAEASTLSSVAQQVETRGVVVTRSDTPRTFSVQVVRAPAGTAAVETENGDVKFVLTIVAILLGVFAALGCACFAHKKLNDVSPVARIGLQNQSQEDEFSQLSPMSTPKQQHASPRQPNVPPQLGSASGVSPFQPASLPELNPLDVLAAPDASSQRGRVDIDTGSAARNIATPDTLR